MRIILPLLVFNLTSAFSIAAQAAKAEDSDEDLAEGEDLEAEEEPLLPPPAPVADMALEDEDDAPGLGPGLELLILVPSAAIGTATGVVILQAGILGAFVVSQVGLFITPMLLILAGMSAPLALPVAVILTLGALLDIDASRILPAAAGAFLFGLVGPPVGIGLAVFGFLAAAPALIGLLNIDTRDPTVFDGFVYAGIATSAALTLVMTGAGAGLGYMAGALLVSGDDYEGDE